MCSSSCGTTRWTPGITSRLPNLNCARINLATLSADPIWKDHLFFFSDYQGTRQVAGAETGLVTVPTAAERQGNFDPSTLTGTIDGPYWAQVLSQRLGYAVTPGEQYSFVGCATTTQCVFPGGVIPQAAWASPTSHILPYIPTPTLPGDVNNYSNNSQKSSIHDNKFGERVDFNNQTTGNWSWYYNIDNTTVDSALAGFATVPGFPTTTPSRAQEFVMSNTKTIGSTAVNEARISFFRTSLHKDNPAGSFADLSSLGFVTGANTLGHCPAARVHAIYATGDLGPDWNEHRRAHTQYLPARYHVHGQRRLFERWPADTPGNSEANFAT